MKKVVHITNDLQRLGGVQRLLVDLMTLQKDDFVFEVILTRGENEYDEELKQLGVEVYHKRDIGLLGVIKRMNKADLVHAHLFPSLYIALLTSTPTVITEHNPHYRRRDIPLVKTMESILYRKYAKIACISEGVQRDFLSSIKVKPSVTKVIHNGVNLSRFPQIAKSYPDKKSVFKLGMVGRFAAQKDIKTLIDLMALLDDTFELHLAGDGELREQFEQYSKKLNVSHRIQFHGQVNDVPTFLDSLDIYIQSSFWEGFGIAVVEAMAAGLPCFATNVSGLNDVIDQPYLFEVGDATDLAAKIVAIKASEELYQEAARYAVKQSIKFSIATSALEYTRVYNLCMASVSR
jgi:glycosyltransferase involved in cell wall biosynthesis